MLWGNKARAPQLLKPTCPRARDPPQKNPLQWEAPAPPLKRNPAHRNQRKLGRNKDLAGPKN